uniref:Macaca fascicularis brain cDNA clone: QflA-11842, similar to human ras homolog gene family, member U (RHOU), mRNA, RefSeq: NM_021205.4 n=1 Tax=Macaca fascicularis TaxID=9541 RepID=I7GAJ5_MACFA|nr:unnamed protein product [Macaca fascicularis]
MSGPWPPCLAASCDSEIHPSRWQLLGPNLLEKMCRLRRVVFTLVGMQPNKAA